VDKTFTAPVNSYLVIGFNDLKRASVLMSGCNCSSGAPNKARVAGEYFNAKRTNVLTSVSDRFLMIAKNRLQEVSILASGIFLM